MCTNTSLFHVKKKDVIKACNNAIEYVESDWENFEWCTLRLAEELIESCKVSCEDTVLLSKSDARFVNGWLS